MIRWVSWLVLCVGAGAHASATAGERPPRVLVDHGACPFECCHYGRWTTSRKVPAYIRPDADSLRLAWIPAGAPVGALDGVVRTVGQPFHVRKPHAGYRRGDTLMVYTYLGEGVFRIWHSGQWREEDLGFSPYGGSPGARCTDDDRCWGALSTPLRSDWWVRVRLPGGRVGWVRGDAGFAGQDACS